MRDKKIYKNRIEILENKNRIFGRRLRNLAWFRLFFFVSTIVAFYLFFSVHVLLAVAGSALFIALFIWSIIRYNKTHDSKKFTERLMEINQNEIYALHGQLNTFQDGAEFMDAEHPFSFDMDVFGAGSIFQFLNRTRSQEGKTKLASMLANNELNIAKITGKQELVKELSEKIDFRHYFAASFSLVDGYQPQQKQQLFAWFERPSFFKARTALFLSFALPALFMMLVLLSIFGAVPVNLLLYAFLINLGVIGFRLKEINHIHAMLSEHGTKLKEYAGILQLVENENFHSGMAVALKTSLHHGDENSSNILKKLGNLVDLFDNRLNLVVNIIMNGFLLWDFHCIRRLEKWKKKYKDSVSRWFTVVSEFDAYISLANYAFNYPDNGYPHFSDDEPFLDASNMGHPLINPNELVRNDYSMNQQNFIIITGANMAGKSTFLRTVGINLILAMAGAPVCADRFLFKPTKLFTSMRTSDSLQKNESYFYAELKRLKDLLEMIKKKEKVMIILDEILKGTNSEDKQKGSKLFLQQLVNRNATGIIATHDLALASLEASHHGKIKNYCFEIEIEGENIHFDYKLKDGVTKKMNASLLMEQMGLLDHADNV